MVEVLAQAEVLAAVVDQASPGLVGAFPGLEDHLVGDYQFDQEVHPADGYPSDLEDRPVGDPYLVRALVPFPYLRLESSQYFLLSLEIKAGGIPPLCTPARSTPGSQPAMYSVANRNPAGNHQRVN